jgi:hypothetical protein
MNYNPPDREFVGRLEDVYKHVKDMTITKNRNGNWPITRYSYLEVHELISIVSDSDTSGHYEVTWKGLWYLYLYHQYQRYASSGFKGPLARYFS